MFPLQGLLSRAQFWKDAALYSWWWLMLLLWTLFSNAAVVRDNLFSPEAQQRWRVLALLPSWGWETWVIGILLILLLAAMEGAYRKWEREHRRVVELTEETHVTFTVYGIPCPQIFGQHRFLFVPEVTVTNHSYGRTVAIDVELSMLGAGGFTAVCPAASRSVGEWEQLPQGRGFSHIVFPLRLSPRDVAKGYIAFLPPPGLGGQLSFSPLRSPTGGARCQIRFTDCHSSQLLHEEEIEFHGI